MNLWPEPSVNWGQWHQGKPLSIGWVVNICSKAADAAPVRWSRGIRIGCAILRKKVILLFLVLALNVLFWVLAVAVILICQGGDKRGQFGVQVGGLCLAYLPGRS